MGAESKVGVVISGSGDPDEIRTMIRKVRANSQ